MFFHAMDDMYEWNMNRKFCFRILCSTGKRNVDFAQNLKQVGMRIKKSCQVADENYVTIRFCIRAFLNYSLFMIDLWSLKIFLSMLFG